MEVLKDISFLSIPAIDILMLLMLADVVFGVSVAVFVKKNLWSRKSLFGYARKLYILVLVVIATILDSLFETQGAVSIATVSFYIFVELTSVTENAALLGIPIPPKIIEVLALLRPEEDKKREEELLREELLGYDLDAQLKAKRSSMEGEDRDGKH